MSRFTVTLSSGDELDIEAPDNITDEQLLSLAKKQLQKGESITAIDEVDDDLPPETGDVDTVKSPEPLEYLPTTQEQRTPFIRQPSTQDIIAESSPNNKYQKERDAEANYQRMMADIDDEYQKAFVEDNYGWVKNNPTVNFAMSVASPSAVESIDAGKIPSWGDIGLDAGLNATGLISAPERLAVTAGKALPKLGKLLAPSASRGILPWKNIAVGAVEQGAMSGLEEGALSAMHDRDYSLTAPIVGGVGGGVLGGTATTSMARELVDGGFSKDEIADIMRKLGTTEKGTLDALGKGGVGDLDQLGVRDRKVPTLAKRFLEPEKIWPGDKVYKAVDEGIALKPVRESMDKVDRSRNMSLKAKEKTLSELKELEDTFYKRLIKADEHSRKAADKLLAIKPITTRDGGVLDVGNLYKAMTIPNTTIPLPGYVKDVEATISDPNLRRQIIADVAKASGEEKALKGLLDKGKYENILEKTPDVIESGSILSTVKNVMNRAPHGTKTARDVMKAPVIMGARAKERVKTPNKEVPKYIDPSAYNSNGDAYYAPRGYITWDDLWKDADEMKKKK